MKQQKHGAMGQPQGSNPHAMNREGGGAAGQPLGSKNKKSCASPRHGHAGQKKASGSSGARNRPTNARRR